MNLINILFAITILLIIIPWLWRHRIKPGFSKDELQQKIARHPDKKNILRTETFLKNLYKEINSTRISNRDRKQLNLDADAFICGEIDFLSFFTILEKIQPQSSDIFYDLGSASGKAVFAAALFFNFSKCIGIELLPGLHNTAIAQIKNAKALLTTYDKNTENNFSRKISNIEFINDNILHSDFSDGDVIFINATCFNFSTWEKLIEKFSRLKAGSKIIVTSKKIENEQFKLLSNSLELMSWGMCSLYIYQKL